MITPRSLTSDVQLRVATVEDAPALAEACLRNRDHLAPWEPTRPDDWFTTERQLAGLTASLERYRDGEAVPWLLIHGDRIAGMITLVDIVRGALRSADLGYWVAADLTGRVLATKAVEAVAEIADAELGLHRIEASTVVHNEISQKVLLRTGFELIGVARKYLHIGGTWQDCNLYEKILNNRPPGDQPAS